MSLMIPSSCSLEAALTREWSLSVAPLCRFARPALNIHPVLDRIEKFVYALNAFLLAVREDIEGRSSRETAIRPLQPAHGIGLAVQRLACMGYHFGLPRRFACGNTIVPWPHFEDLLTVRFAFSACNFDHDEATHVRIVFQIDHAQINQRRGHLVARYLLYGKRSGRSRALSRKRSPAFPGLNLGAFLASLDWCAHRNSISSVRPFRRLSAKALFIQDWWDARKAMVSRAGLEPATTALKVRCSTN